MRSSCVLKPIYTAKNLYNNFILLQDFFLYENNVFYVF